MRRADAELVRHFWREGQRVKARELQATPLFDFGACRWEEWIDQSKEFVDEFMQLLPYEAKLPHSPVVTARDVKENKGEEFRLWCYFQDVSQMPEDVLARIEEDVGIAPHRPNDIYCLSWWAFEDTVEMFITCFFPRDIRGQSEDLAIHGAVAKDSPIKKQDEAKFQTEINQRIATVWRELLAITRMSAKCYTAVSTPKTKDNFKTRKTAKFKPWLRQDVPHIIFIEPGREKAHGVETETKRVNDGKTEIEITAHRRRGHFRKLTSAFFRRRRGEVVWVRPTWVGPKEWAHDGVEYRILETS